MVTTCRAGRGAVLAGAIFTDLRATTSGDLLALFATAIKEVHVVSNTTLLCLWRAGRAATCTGTSFAFFGGVTVFDFGALFSTIIKPVNGAADTLLFDLWVVGLAPGLDTLAPLTGEAIDTRLDHLRFVAAIIKQVNRITVTFLFDLCVGGGATVGGFTGAVLTRHRRVTCLDLLSLLTTIVEPMNRAADTLFGRLWVLCGATTCFTLKGRWITGLTCRTLFADGPLWAAC